MAKVKSTHSGHCQVCGCVQKLPNGKLSLHGYTKEFDFFQGICHGAQALPFEQDISLIQAAIERAKESAKNIRENAKKAIEKASFDKLWVSVYKSAQYFNRITIPSRYVWEQHQARSKNLTPGIWFLSRSRKISWIKRSALTLIFILRAKP
jgi:hypothetical protein